MLSFIFSMHVHQILFKLIVILNVGKNLTIVRAFHLFSVFCQLYHKYTMFNSVVNHSMIVNTNVYTCNGEGMFFYFNFVWSCIYNTSYSTTNTLSDERHKGQKCVYIGKKGKVLRKQILQKGK